MERVADPIEMFSVWMAEAEKTEPNDPNAMALATIGADGHPAVRMVLLKGVDDRGFVFYTNLGSRKAKELVAHPSAALCVHWKTQRRQVRVEGRVEAVSNADADAYFATRSRISQLGAWASKQSQPLRGRFELEARLAKYTARFNIGDIPRPPFWSGFCVVPDIIEFWEDRPFRLHMRRVYRHSPGGWRDEELYP